MLTDAEWINALNHLLGDLVLRRTLLPNIWTASAIFRPNSKAGLPGAQTGGRVQNDRTRHRPRAVFLHIRLRHRDCNRCRKLSDLATGAGRASSHLASLPTTRRERRALAGGSRSRPGPRSLRWPIGHRLRHGNGLARTTLDWVRVPSASHRLNATFPPAASRAA